jgi:hypothetical protein
MKKQLKIEISLTVEYSTRIITLNGKDVDYDLERAIYEEGLFQDLMDDLYYPSEELKRGINEYQNARRGICFISPSKEDEELYEKMCGMNPEPEEYDFEAYEDMKEVDTVIKQKFKFKFINDSKLPPKKPK